MEEGFTGLVEKLYGVQQDGAPGFEIRVASRKGGSDQDEEV